MKYAGGERRYTRLRCVVSKVDNKTCFHQLVLYGDSNAGKYNSNFAHDSMASFPMTFAVVASLPFHDKYNDYLISVMSILKGRVPSFQI